MSAEQTNMWDGLVQMGKELKRTHSAGLLAAALTFAYVCIDTMSYLSLPSEKPEKSDKSDRAGKSKGGKEEGGDDMKLLQPKF